ncbi:MAG: hypothetical protein ABH878_06350 [bacterium]
MPKVLTENKLGPDSLHKTNQSNHRSLVAPEKANVDRHFRVEGIL